MRHCPGGGPAARTRTKAAPVGVVASPSTGPPVASSTPSSRIAVAGAGTGSRPCVASTQPPPTATGQVYTASTPSCSNPSMAPTMSSTASTAPTSCRCTCSGATPCTRPSASPTSWNARTARSLTQSDTGARSTSRTSSPTWRPCGCSGIVNSTCLHPTPHRTAFRTVTPTPPSPSRPGNALSQSCGTPRARSAPRVMSPEIPAAGSKIAMRMRPKRWNINGLSPVEPPGARVEDHHPLVGVQLPPRLELDRSGERGAALRRRVDTLERLEVAGRRGEERVSHHHPPTAALPQRAEHQAISEWGGDPQPHGDRPWVGPRGASVGPGLEGPDDRRAPRGLDAVQARRFAFEPAGARQFGERLPHADQSGAAPRGVHDRIGQTPAELLRELEAQGLLALDAVGLAQRGHVHGPSLGGVRAGRFSAVTDVTVHQRQVAAEAADLAEDRGRGGGRRVHARREAGARGVGGERDAGVSCGGYDQPLSPRQRGTGHGGGESASLERAGGVRSFFLHTQLAKSVLRGDSRHREQRRAAL